MNYTVILLRGPKFARHFHDAEPFGTDAYVAHVEAAAPREAVQAGLAQVLTADTRDWPWRDAGVKLTESDYVPLVVLEGRAQGIFWNWELRGAARNIPV